MLFLTRIAKKHRDTVLINVPGHKPIRVVLRRIDDTQIRLGFDAPRDVEILREELVTKNGK